MMLPLVAAGTVAAIVGVVLSVIALLIWWIGSVSDILWMAFLRRRLVMIVVPAIATVAMLLAVLVGAGVETTLAAAVLIAPLLARPLCNWWEVSRWRRRSTGIKSPKSLFDVVRLEQQEAYTAPVVAPR